MLSLSRRRLFGAAAAGVAGLAAGCATGDSSAAGSVGAGSLTLPQRPAGVSPTQLAKDETYWGRVAACYDVTDKVTQLENGNWGVIARPVMADYQLQLERVNRENSYYQRREYGRDMRPIIQRTADMLGVAPEEIAYTRNATEALHVLIGGYNRLKPGDTVLYADHDYDSMIPAMKWLEQRRGVKAVGISLPEPASRAAVLETYAAALKDNPGVKLVLLTHLGHRSGLVIPVAEISDMARAQGADVVVDAAHSFGQIDFKLPDLKADFIGVNLHKWVGAPLGVGLAYIKRDRIPDIDPHMGATERDLSTIAARVHPGTVNFAAFLSIPAAIDFHEGVGVSFKEARLRYLRDLWAEPARANPKIEVLTPADTAMHAGITCFRLKGKASDADNIALARRLLDEFGIFTVYRTGLANGACIRVTPALFTSPADVLKLKAALEAIAA
jgi:isopenicillin-N epimerase